MGPGSVRCLTPLQDRAVLHARKRDYRAVQLTRRTTVQLLAGVCFRCTESGQSTLGGTVVRVVGKNPSTPLDSIQLCWMDHRSAVAACPVLVRRARGTASLRRLRALRCLEHPHGSMDPLRLEAQTRSLCISDCAGAAVHDMARDAGLGGSTRGGCGKRRWRRHML